MYKTSDIMLMPSLADAIAKELKNKSYSVYLLYCVLINTGYTAKTISSYTVAEMEQFIVQNNDLLSPQLKKELKEHMVGKHDNEFFFVGVRAEDNTQPICKRSYENLIGIVGRKHGIDKLGVKAVSRAFYYNYLRKNNYNFSTVQLVFKKRGRNQDIHTLEGFLDYCGITIEELVIDMADNLYPSVDAIVQYLETYDKYIVEKKRLLEEGNYTHNSLLKIKAFVDNLPPI